MVFNCTQKTATDKKIIFYTFRTAVVVVDYGSPLVDWWQLDAFIYVVSLCKSLFILFFKNIFPFIACTTWVWEEFSEAKEYDFWLVPRRFWQTVS